MNKIFKLALILLTSIVYAQTSFIEHKTIKGETAFSISQKYKITLNDLYQYNTEAQNGVSENQILKIPVYSMANAPTSGGILHTVAPKETLYGISKKYGVTAESITKANESLLADGLKVGQQLTIPKKGIAQSQQKNTSKNETKTEHSVLPKESLFSIARAYNVSVEDLSELNKDLLIDGLKSGQQIQIPNKKKTLDGRVRVINEQTVFHTVAPKETKYSIAKQYGISIEQLESQNPEIISGLVEGNKLAINKDKINPENDTEELMLALAEKQVVVEKSKAKTNQIQELTDRLAVEKEMNQKIIKINNLKFDLNSVEWEKGNVNSAEKLKLVLEANKNMQEVLMGKLDSLIIYMGDDLASLKELKVNDLEETKRLEKESYKNIAETNEMSNNLKRELANNRKNYADLMNKVERIALAENQEYKKKVREGELNKREAPTNIYSLEELNKYKEAQAQSDKQNEALLVTIDSLGTQKTIEVKRHISKATFYSREARAYDDKMALLKIKRHQTEAIKQQNGTKTPVESIAVSPQEGTRVISENPDYYNAIIADMEIFDNLREQEVGFYLVLKDFEDAGPRDEFIMKLIDAGDFNASFFFNVNSLTYYVYSDYSKNIEGLLITLKKQKEKNNYNKVKIVKLENND